MGMKCLQGMLDATAMHQNRFTLQEGIYYVRSREKKQFS